MSQPVRFDEDTHTYWMGDRKLISVTTVLREARLFDYGNLGMAADRGTAIHTVTELDDAGALDTTKLVNPLLGPLEGWRKFRDDSKIEVLGTEEVVYHSIYLYAGKCDRRIRWKGKLGVIDIKSGGRAPWHALQTMAYAKCYPDPMTRFCLYLGSDGTYRLEEHNDPSDWDVFRAALALVNWKRKNGSVKI